METTGALICTSCFFSSASVQPAALVTTSFTLYFPLACIGMGSGQVLCPCFHHRRTIPNPQRPAFDQKTHGMGALHPRHWDRKGCCRFVRAPLNRFGDVFTVTEICYQL